MTLHNSDASEYSSTMTFTEELRAIVRDCGLSRYEIAKRTGLSQGGLAAFMAGGDVTTRTLDAIAPVLGLKLTATLSGTRTGSGSATKTKKRKGR